MATADQTQRQGPQEWLPCRRLRVQIRKPHRRRAAPPHPHNLRAVPPPRPNRRRHFRDAGAALASGQPAAAAAPAARAAAVQLAALWCRDRRTAGRGGGQVEPPPTSSFATRDARTEVTGRTKKCTIRPCTSHRRAASIDLQECASRPGLSIVAGGHHGNGGAGLSRDSDYLYLACTPAALLRYFYAVAPGQTSCMCGGGAACDRVDRNDTAEPLTSCATNIGGLPCERLLPNCIDANKTRAALVPADFARCKWTPTSSAAARCGARRSPSFGATATASARSTVPACGAGSSATSSTRRWATAVGRERARNRQSGWGTSTGFLPRLSPSSATGVAGRSVEASRTQKVRAGAGAPHPAARDADGPQGSASGIAGPARVRGSCRSFTRSQLRSERRLRLQSRDLT